MRKHISNTPAISLVGCQKQNSSTDSKTQYPLVSGIHFLYFISFHLKQNFKILRYLVDLS